MFDGLLGFVFCAVFFFDAFALTVTLHFNLVLATFAVITAVPFFFAMICADFFRNEHDRLVGFRITGHAGYADYGEDVCCASVSSAVMLTANTVTEAFKIKADVAVEENEIILRLENDSSEEGDKLLLGLLTHLYFLAEEFSGRIKVTVRDN